MCSTFLIILIICENYSLNPRNYSILIGFECSEAIQIRYLAGGNANSDEMMCSMVIKLDGSSEHVAHMCKESGLIDFRQLSM